MLNEKLVTELNRFNKNGESIQVMQTGDVILSKPYEVPRNIGKVFLSEDTAIYRKQEKEEHIVRKFNGWSINKVVLNVADIIEYVTKEAVYQISRSDAYRHGKYLSNPTFGLDEKIVVPLQYWTKRYVSASKELARRLLGDSWGAALHQEVEKPYFKEISDFLRQEREKKKVYPSREMVFRAFHETPFYNVKAILVGNQPIGLFEPDGLAYSYGKLCPVMKDFFNIVEEVCYDGLRLDNNTRLDNLAKQGILLINRVLTTSDNPEKHADIGWKQFTETAILTVMESNQKIIFLTLEEDCGNYIQDLSEKIGTRTGETPLHFHSLSSDKQSFKNANFFFKKQFSREIIW